MKKPRHPAVHFYHSNKTPILVVLGMVAVFAFDRMFPMVFAQQPKNSDTANPASATKIVACVNNTNGNMRNVKTESECKDIEHPLALQAALNRIISDPEVIWYTPPEAENRDYSEGIKVVCPEGKQAIGGGGTQVLSASNPFGSALSGSGGTAPKADGWFLSTWRAVETPVAYVICAKVN